MVVVEFRQCCTAILPPFCHKFLCSRPQGVDCSLQWYSSMKLHLRQLMIARARSCKLSTVCICIQPLSPLWHDLGRLGCCCLLVRTARWPKPSDNMLPTAGEQSKLAAWSYIRHRRIRQVPKYNVHTNDNCRRARPHHLPRVQNRDSMEARQSSEAKYANHMAALYETTKQVVEDEVGAPEVELQTSTAS